ncbi:hypothetical protein ACFL1S_02315 [Pseudomonadota bacterium]
MDLFIMDGENVQLPLWQGSGHACVLDEVSEQIIVLSETEASISIICNEDKGDSRKMLMRVIRELAMYHCFQGERLIMHAAASRSEQGGIMLTGAKNSGKTSLLLAMLEWDEYSYVTNDRACVKLQNEVPSIRGIPTIVSVGRVTLTEGSQTAGAIAQENAKYLLTNEERRRNQQDPKPENAKGNYTLSPLQFCTALECKMAAASPLTRIVVLNNSSAVEAPIFNDLSIDEAAGALFRNSFNSMAVGSETVFSLVYGMGVKVARDSVHQRCLEFAARMPIMGVTLDSRKLDSICPALLERFAQSL